MKDIPNFEGLYAITEDGQVWSYKRKKFLKRGINECGYPYVGLRQGNKCKQFFVHRLVALTYIPNPHNYPEVNHMDEDKMNPHVSNLEWCTHAYNLNYGTRIKKQAESLSKYRKANPQPTNVKAVYCIELDKTYSTIKQAADELSINGDSISACCRGRLKTAGKYHWTYAKVT